MSPPIGWELMLESLKRMEGNILKGRMILEVPVQKKPVPESILKYAQDKNIQIRDINGKVYK
jgi:conserved hypothetical protein